MFHGQGAADMDIQKEDEISQFFHRIDESLSSFLSGERVPLVFAGVEYLFPLFRESCHYHGLIEQPLTGNPDKLTAEELHGQAWPLVEPSFCRHRDDALGRYHDLARSAEATADVKEIIRAARQGAVDTLLIKDGERRWGVVDEDLGSVVPTDEVADGAEELLNYAAIHTLRGGGTVYSLPPALPLSDGQPSAALLRFAVA
jgi:hypothetical protein